MAKKKIVDDNVGVELQADLFQKISKGIGGELLEDRDKNSWGFIDTGILGLNYILSGKFIGGGVQAGACIEILGNSSSCKSLIGTNILRGVQTQNGIPVMLDAERTISKDFAKKASRIDPNRFIVVEADTLEMCFNKIHTTIRNVREEMKFPLKSPLAIVYDSIAVSPSEREFAETELDLETATDAEKKAVGAGADKPGERAKICSKELRKIPPILSTNNCTLIIINQIREKIGVMFGSNETTASGGRSLEYYTSMRLKTFSSKQIKDHLDRVIGINLNVKCIKNKCHMPFGEIRSLRVFFNKGIDPFGGLLELLLQNGRIVQSGAGTYKISEPWAGGKEIKFKSSKERNDVPASVLLECPALVDATSPEQVEYYVDMFGDALNAANHDVGKEEDIVRDE